MLSEDRKNTSEENKKDNVSVQGETPLLEVESDTPFPNIFEDMLNYLTETPAVFKSQQIDDPELTVSDKKKIGEELLNKNPISFLLKFGAYLKPHHLVYFSPSNKQVKWSEELGLHVKMCEKSLDIKAAQILKKNRRFGALRKLQKDGKYFSEAEMEKREPLLYHQLVGQYLSQREKIERLHDGEEVRPNNISSLLMMKAERDETDALFKAQKDAEEACEEETESSDDDTCHTIEDVKQNGEGHQSNARWGDDWTDKKEETKRKPRKDQKKVSKILPTEKELLLSEFRSIMYAKFLDGGDSEFDYSTVDCNPDYDCLEVFSQDAEEQYFDSEEIGECEDICTDTGIEDY